MFSERNPAVYLQDILNSIARIRNYLGGISFSAFEYLEDKQDAVIRRLTILSEAVTRLRAAQFPLPPEIAWAAIHNLRNTLRHEYDAIDLDTIWNIVHQDLPALKNVVEKLLREQFPNAPARS